MLQAKRPHENTFTEWCTTDDYEVIERNIKIIESYGWQWRLKEDNSLKDQLRSEVAREIFAELEFDIHQLMFERDETRSIAIEGIIAAAKKRYTEEEKNDT
jgi:hypothetical protein